MTEGGVQMSTLVFLDFEATGLNNGKTKVTELALLSVQREELVTPYGTPRVVNKLTLCVNPMKPISPRASEITGLYNENLESQSEFDEQVIDMMISYLTRLPQPVCLVAHYGNGYDFRLLAAELAKKNKCLPGNIYCADSLEGFRELDGLPRTYGSPANSPPNVTPTKLANFECPIKSTPSETVLKSSLSVVPAKSSSCLILMSNADVSQSIATGSFNCSTPVSQQIPSDLECPDIKERAKLAKRKHDTDLHALPLKAKACRKRLFEAGNVSDDLHIKLLEGENIDEKLDITPLEGKSGNEDQNETIGSNPNMLIVTPNAVGVIQKLDFEHSPADSKSSGFDGTVKVKVDSTEQDIVGSSNILSQSSIPDNILDITPLGGERGNEDQNDTVSSKPNMVIVTPNAVGVIKKLDLELSSVDSKSSGVEETVKVKVDSTEQDNDSNILSQSSIPDNVLLAAVHVLEDKLVSGENENKNSSAKKDDTSKTDEKDTKSVWYNKVVVQCVNTGISYTLSKAERHDKLDSYVTASPDHRRGPISSYEMNHKHFRTHGIQNTTDVMPKKDTDTTLQKLYFLSDSLKKREMDNKALDIAGKKDYGARETTPELLAKSGETTPVKRNELTTLDTPVSHLPPRLSYKLSEVYKRTFGHLPNVSHAAEDDCVSLMKIVKKSSPEFLNWIDKNAVLFSTITPL